MYSLYFISISMLISSLESTEVNTKQKLAAKSARKSVSVQIVESVQIVCDLVILNIICLYNLPVFLNHCSIGNKTKNVQNICSNKKIQKLKKKTLREVLLTSSVFVLIYYYAHT